MSDDAEKIAKKYDHLGGEKTFGKRVGTMRKFTITVLDNPKPDPKPKPKRRNVDDRGSGNGGTVGEHPEVPTHEEVVAFAQDCEKGAIISNVGGKCFGVFGLIWNKWHKLGGWGSSLRWPNSDIQPTEAAGGSYAHFQGGTVALMPNSGEAFEVEGAILDKWDRLGDTLGVLGFPTTDETNASDGVGRFNHFTGRVAQNGSAGGGTAGGVTASGQSQVGVGQSPNISNLVRLSNASVFWKPTVGAHESHGLIRSTWGQLGLEKSKELGYPISDVLRVPGTDDQFQDFENGLVFLGSDNSAANVMQFITFPVEGLPMPLSPDEILKQMRKTFGEILDEMHLQSPVKKISITGGPSFRLIPGPLDANENLGSPVTDYSVDRSGGVRNRQYRIRVSVTAETDDGHKLEVQVDINVEIYLDRDDGPNGTIKAQLGRYSYHSHMGGLGITDGVVAMIDHCFLEPILAKLVREPKEVLRIPKSAPPLLALKVMPDGTLELFMAPVG